MKRLALFLFIPLSAQIFAADKPGAEKIFEGEISDSQCGFNIHSMNRSHDEMLKTGYMGKSAEECARNCVRGHGGQFVFVSSDKKTAYKIDEQELAKDFAGQKVQIQGTLDKDHRLHIINLKPLQ